MQYFCENVHGIRADDDLLSAVRFPVRFDKCCCHFNEFHDQVLSKLSTTGCSGIIIKECRSLLEDIEPPLLGGSVSAWAYQGFS